MAFKYSIRLSGAGGQGLIQAARIIAEAAAIYDNNNAAESCSYGPEARGNASRADIIISDDAIDYPKVDAIDLLMVLTQEAYDKCLPDAAAGAVIIADSRIKTGQELSTRKLHHIPFIQVAEKDCGRASMVNIVALGYLAAVCDVIDKKSIRKAMLARVPKMSEHIYICAYEAGLKLAKDSKAV